MKTSGSGAGLADESSGFESSSSGSSSGSGSAVGGADELGSSWAACFWAAISSAVRKRPPGPLGRRMACLCRDSCRYG
jgi:hypothetical protein